MSQKRSEGHKDEEKKDNEDGAFRREYQDENRSRHSSRRSRSQNGYREDPEMGDDRVGKIDAPENMVNGTDAMNGDKVENDAQPGQDN